MRPSARIDPKYLLHSLNGKRDFGAEKRRNALGPAKLVRFEDGTQRGVVAASGEDYTSASEVFLSELRKLVDEWLDSGRDGQGIEEPQKRSLENAPNAYEAMNGWLLNKKFSGLATTSGDITFLLGTEVRNDGEDTPIADAYDQACLIFVRLMESPVKYKLFKCSDISCGYYVLEKPRKRYKRETYCAEHRYRVSARRGTQESRNREKGAVFGTALDAMRAWRKLSEREKAKKHKTEKEYIGDEINLRHSKGGNWVTRNMSLLIREIDKNP
jgi:hypothetical protein